MPVKFKVTEGDILQDHEKHTRKTMTKLVMKLQKKLKTSWKIKYIFEGKKFSSYLNFF